MASRSRKARERKGQVGGDPVARLREICMALPDALEKISHGTLVDASKRVARLDERG